MLSPHSYKKFAMSNGLSSATIATAVSRYNKIGEQRDSPVAILTLKHLAKRSKVSYSYLREVVGRTTYTTYRTFKIKKRSGGNRHIYIPEKRLLYLQKWINKNIISKVEDHKTSFAFRPGRSIVDCAKVHCSARWLIKLDIKDFFESVSEIQVFRVFRNIGYSPLVSFELSRIVTTNWKSNHKKKCKEWNIRKENTIIPVYSEKKLGYLPQGAPTSPMLSNLVMIELDKKIEIVARNHKLVYTRYCDDMIFSTSDEYFDRKNAKHFIYEINMILSSNGFRSQKRKTTVVPPGAKKLVLGLVVNDTAPKLKKEYKDNIRLHLYYLKKHGVTNHRNKRKFNSIMGMKQHILGLINFAKMVEPEYGNLMLAKFEQIKWPVK